MVSRVQAKLTSVQVDALVAKLNDMVEKADAKYEVTVDMLKRSARCKVVSQGICVRDALGPHRLPTILQLSSKAL